jgi:glucokinase
VTGVLLADIGGTNARLALGCGTRDRPLDRGSVREYEVARHESLAACARHYLDEIRVKPARAVIAAAGPVAGEEIRLTNHPWSIQSAELQRELSLQSVELLNDFSAIATSLPVLEEVEPVGKPRLAKARPPQRFVVLGPGTGLGVAALMLRERDFVVVDSEGGHAEFAPSTSEEREILRVLARRFGRVSWERLLSGPGLENIYAALSEIDGAAQALRAAEIQARASNRSDERAVRAARAFAAMLGAFAGDMVLTFGAWDGAYLAGGLARHLRAWVAEGGFRERFEDKGRFAKRLANVPTIAILDQNPGLLGAGVHAAARS